ncbi:MAG: hypothetical protein ACK55Z_06025, partial [bacterium]
CCPTRTLCGRALRPGSTRRPKAPRRVSAAAADLARVAADPPPAPLDPAGRVASGRTCDAARRRVHRAFRARAAASADETGPRSRRVQRRV